MIIDGACHTEYLRNPFINYIKEKELNVSILYIDVNVGLEMAKVFNHVCVEESQNEATAVYKIRDYNIYRSYFKKPKTDSNSTFITYYPRIEDKKTVMYNRY